MAYLGKGSAYSGGNGYRLFKSYQILNVIDSPNEGVTYCVQYHADNIENFNQFYSKHLHELQAIHNHEFENQFVLFNTLMQTVD